MLDPRQDQTLEDLAKAIAASVDALGGTCTAQLLARIALGLVDPGRSDQPQASTSPASRASEPGGTARPITHRHAGWHSPISNHRRRRRTRP